MEFKRKNVSKSFRNKDLQKTSSSVAALSSNNNTTIDTSNLVTLNTEQTIEAAKNFSDKVNFFGTTYLNNAELDVAIVDDSLNLNKYAVIDFNMGGAQIFYNPLENQLVLTGGGDPLVYIPASLLVEDDITSKGEVTAYSDKRLKENIEILTDRGYIIPVSYNKIGDEKNKKSIGFIAQDVKALYPELVVEDSKGYLSVNYMQYVAVLQAQIIELNERINKLEQQIKP